jgi:hypothetical protein
MLEKVDTHYAFETWFKELDFGIVSIEKGQSK